MTLYEITGQYLDLLNMMEDGEIDEETFRDTLESLEGDLENKADKIAMILRQCKADMDSISEEEKRLKARRQSIDKRVDSLKDYLKSAMEITGNRKFKTPLFSFGIQKNPVSVKIDDLGGIPECFLKKRELTESDVDKTKIKELLQSGDSVHCSFAHLEQTEGLRIR